MTAAARPESGESDGYPSKAWKVRDHCRIVWLGNSLIYVNDPKSLH